MPFAGFFSFIVKVCNFFRKARPSTVRRRMLALHLFLGKIIRKLSWSELSFLLLTKISGRMTG